tara:strand:- start:132671 stop:132811 length:141 start_codon:yes stop_codon:yes gene_type:complete
MKLDKDDIKTPFFWGKGGEEKREFKREKRRGGKPLFLFLNLKPNLF